MTHRIASLARKVLSGELRVSTAVCSPNELRRAARDALAGDDSDLDYYLNMAVLMDEHAGHLWRTGRQDSDGGITDFEDWIDGFGGHDAAVARFLPESTVPPIGRAA